MVFKKIIFQNRYMALETPSRPPPSMAKTILNFHFDYWNPSLRYNDQLTLYYKEDTDYWRHFQKREALGFEDVSSGPQTKVFNFSPSKINWTKMVFTPHI